MQMRQAAPAPAEGRGQVLSRSRSTLQAAQVPPMAASIHLEAGRGAARKAQSNGCNARHQEKLRLNAAFGSSLSLPCETNQ
jgi:hypothetical protein